MCTHAEVPLHKHGRKSGFSRESVLSKQMRQHGSSGASASFPRPGIGAPVFSRSFRRLPLLLAVTLLQRRFAISVAVHAHNFRLRTIVKTVSPTAKVRPRIVDARVLGLSCALHILDGKARSSLRVWRCKVGGLAVSASRRNTRDADARHGRLVVVTADVRPHDFMLDDDGLGVQRLGDAGSFIGKLDRGEPVTVVILGSSVAENGGCISQPQKRCMNNNGLQPIPMVWGTPRARKFKGFMVRFFEWLNATWPHPEHKLYNAARDAASLNTILPCLFSHIPPRADLLLLETGSMFMGSPTTTEVIARQILSMHVPPTIAMLTSSVVHLWRKHFEEDVWTRAISAADARLPILEATCQPERCGLEPHPSRPGRRGKPIRRTREEPQQALRRLRYQLHIAARRSDARLHRRAPWVQHRGHCCDCASRAWDFGNRVHD